MIQLNRLNGQPFVLNPDLLERAEPTPDTVITLITGAKYVVAQSLDDLSDLVREHRARVVGRARVELQEPGRVATVLHFPEGDA